MNLKWLRRQLFLSVNEKYKDEFSKELARISLLRGRATALVLFSIEIIVLLLSLTFNGDHFFEPPYLYYHLLYILMITVTFPSYFLFTKLSRQKNDASKKLSALLYAIISFVLLWNVAITLLDQQSYGQVINYFIALVGVGLITNFEPFVLLIIYLSVHTIFLSLLPLFQKSSTVLFGHIINTTIVLIISWFIQWLLFKNSVSTFNTKKLVEEKNIELKELNTKLQLANLELELLSKRDGLTGIYNRFMFDQSLTLALKNALRDQAPLSLILLDIDCFKAYNDFYGHQAGDLCIQKIAKILAETASNHSAESSFAARYGGEEFAVVFQTSPPNAFDIAEQIRKSVMDLQIPHEASIVLPFVTVSLGVHTAVPTEQMTIQDYIAYADKSLYQAKNENRNKTCLSTQ